MPSSVGHALGAIAVGWGAGSAPASPARLLTHGVAFAALGVAPDLDLLMGRHRAETHRLGAAVIVACLAVAVRWPTGTTAMGRWLVVFTAWGSHVLLDALGADTTPPYGVMAFWPVSSEFVKFEWDLFYAVSRRWQAPGFLAHTMTAVLWELVILLPIVLLVGRWRRGARAPDGRRAIQG